MFAKRFRICIVKLFLRLIFFHATQE
jgi:hypothetical protein